ncbi:MAG: PQQ-dependent sugar dehydrogenase, partial [Planctomycetales bacterium]|nr:PQQ-dependent sugar dehydrogenase [Planctomycetales bacterium]
MPFAKWNRRLPPSRLPKVETLEVRTLLTATFIVDTPLDTVDANPGDGLAQDANGRTSLRAAVMEANALAGDDTIQLAPGLYTLTRTGAESDATRDLDVRSTIKIEATETQLTTISTIAADRIFQVHAGASLVLSGVVVAGGNTAGLGGGVFNEGTLDVVRSTLRNNTASAGSAIANAGDARISETTISANHGSAIYNDATGALTVVRSTITNNTAAAAAGIDNLGVAVLDNAIVAGNVGTTTNTDVAGAFSSAGRNLIGNVGDGSATSGFSSDDFVGTASSPIDPKLAPLTLEAGTYTHPLLPGSVAIDGGKNVVADSSGQGNDAAIVGSIVAGPGQRGLSADFPGGVGDIADDFIAVGVSGIAPADIPTGAITVAAWANLTHTGNTHAIFASRTGSGAFITHAEVRDDGQARFTLRDDAGNTIIDFIGGSVPFDQWIHYAATYDQATNHVAVYIDGAAIFDGPATLNAAIGGDWDGGARIGATTTGGRPFTGQMDEFYVFTRALDDTEVATLAALPPGPTGAPQVSGDLSIYYSFDDVIATTLDQRGGPRILDGDGIAGATIDIGAYERFNDFNPDDPIPEKIQQGNVTVRVSPLATGLVSPSQVFNAGDGSGRLFVTDQIGYVFLIEDGTLQSTPFLDITSTVPHPLNGNDERGLSGFAFHPDFAVQGADGYGKFYTWVDEIVDAGKVADFTHYPLDPGVQRAAQSVLREWTMDDITDDVFSGVSREIVRIDQPHQAHSAGNAAFGPDGYLYLSLGDGGTHDDQGPGHNPETGNAQDLSTIYGSVLRIDPMGNNSANGKYGIPPTNPFVGNPEALDEIYFYGLRNPFRFSFELDAQGNKTTKVAIGDTGQDDIEEVDYADILTDAGGNFGWHVKEGSFLFDPGPPPSPSGELRIGITAYSPGAPLGMIDPVVEYDHGPNGEGSAVIGGYFYQGNLIPELKGKYIFGDFNNFAGPSGTNGRIFYTDFSAENPEIFELNLEGALLSGAGGLGMFIKGFGLDEEGEIYVVGSTTLASADNSGVIVKLRPATGVVSDVVVSPTSGLVTSEDGGEDHFDVVLTAPPTHPVSFSVASSRTSEGTVSTNQVTFLPSNWDVPQTVTVTGVDDDKLDGPVRYTIYLGPVVSDDLEFAGINPTDVSVSNLDNEFDPASFTIEVPALRDNTLYESETGLLSNGSGQYLFAGTTAADDLRRALLSFDLVGLIPPDATITNVSLRLNMSRTISGTSDVSLHRVLTGWGEAGSDASAHEGGGAPAEPGDATWLHTFFDTEQWATPGGDFAPGASATESVAGIGTYVWNSPFMVADLRTWLSAPSTNNGWVLVGDESQTASAKRFDSRENPDALNVPTLIITYSTPPIAADGNLDGVVNGLDYLVWASHFGDNPAQNPPGSPANGDYDKNGVVDGLDYVYWVSRFGTSKLPPAGANVAKQATAREETYYQAVDTAVEQGFDTGATIA